MSSSWVVAAFAVATAGCGGGTERADVRLRLEQTTVTARHRPESFPRRVLGWLVPTAHAQAATCPVGVQCVTPTELSVKITSVYVTHDIDPATGANVGPADGSQPYTQAVYASPNCPAIADASGASVGQPNLGNCGIDIGATSSSTPPQTIVAAPDYIDLALGSAAVNAALDASTFGVAKGSYRYLRLEIGSNAPTGQFGGTEETLSAGTPMNIRFFAPGMAAPFEIRRILGADVQFDEPLEIDGDEVIDLTLGYNLTGVVLVIPDGSAVPVDVDACTSSQSGFRYCLDVGRIHFEPSIDVGASP